MFQNYYNYDHGDKENQTLERRFKKIKNFSTTLWDGNNELVTDSPGYQQLL